MQITPLTRFPRLLEFSYYSHEAEREMGIDGWNLLQCEPSHCSCYDLSKFSIVLVWISKCEPNQWMADFIKDPYLKFQFKMLCIQISYAFIQNKKIKKSHMLMRNFDFSLIKVCWTINSHVLLQNNLFINWCGNKIDWCINNILNKILNYVFWL